MNCFVCRFSKLLDSQTLQCIGAHSTLFSIFCKSAYLLFHSIAVPFCTCVCVRLHQRNWRKKIWRVYRMIQAILRLKKLLQILFYEWVTHDSSFRAINAECARIWSDNLQLACVFKEVGGYLTRYVLIVDCWSLWMMNHESLTQLSWYVRIELLWQLKMNCKIVW